MISARRGAAFRRCRGVRGVSRKAAALRIFQNTADERERLRAPLSEGEET